MSFDFSSLLWVVFAIIVLQPLLVGRWYAVQRAQALRAIGKLHGARDTARLWDRDGKPLAVLRGTPAPSRARCSRPMAAAS